MKVKINPTYEVRLYIGSRQGYAGEAFNEDDLLAAISAYQETNKKLGISGLNDLMTTVRVTPTTYIVGDYRESGWEIAAIIYPRNPQKTSDIDSFMSGLAIALLEDFGQNRISVVYPNRTILYEADNAEERHDHDRPKSSSS